MSNRIKELTDQMDGKLDKQKSLLRELNIASALQVEFPNVFDHGSIKSGMSCIGNQAVYPDAYSIKITKGNGDEIKVPLKDTNFSDDILKLMMPKGVVWRKTKRQQDIEKIHSRKFWEDSV
tara:strand:+ start:368 stop:730 length:363 start_codon:yes stop_codon:yes gene_type:complete